ncbi:MAG TPA: thiamine pyrophosphate-binding protein, partial [Xanthobacteraceae bacterium]|nr:thiamine pyrophosphate-binding protein [Xanthobacteraceae bacterium]
MSRHGRDSDLSRRGLLKGATAAGVAVVGSMRETKAYAQTRTASPITPPPNSAMESGHPPEQPIVQGSSGSDYMADVIKSLGIEHVACNPGTSFRGLHESLINYLKIDWHTCLHEEASVAMANGYAKIEGKPLLVLAHGTVGLQHASMALYNAWCDRSPVYMMVGNTVDATKRSPGGEWVHSVQDAAAMVRDYVKWDDLPGSLTHFGESAVRAYNIAMTPPMAPVLLVLDSEMQDGPVPPNQKLVIPKLPKIAPLIGDPGAVTEAAELLVNAANPVIVADRCARSQAGINHLVELAETLQCAVVDLGGRLNFPSRHVLNQSDRARAVVSQADVIVGLELENFWGATHTFHDNIERYADTNIKPGTKLVSIGAAHLYVKANYQDFQRFTDIDLVVPADAQATLPYLIETVQRLIPADRRAAMIARGEKLAAAHRQATKALKEDALYAWDTSPIATSRLSAELWEAIRNEDWSLGSLSSNNRPQWPQRLWDMKKHYHHTGPAGGGGIGYGAPAAAGAALANRKHGRLTVTIQADGDLMYSPGVLWTCAHSRLPVLYVMHNNRAYHQEMMGLQRMANRRERGVDRTHIGCTLDDPFIDYAT